MKWEVVVGNIGTVYSGLSEVQARGTYLIYQRKSDGGEGRAAGESVTLFCDGEIVKEYVGKNEE